MRKTYETKAATVGERHHLVVVGPSVPGRCLFGDRWTISHPPSSSSLPHISVVIIQAHASFLYIHLLLQVYVWATGVIILGGGGGGESQTSC